MWHQYQYFYKVQGPIPIFLQSAGTNSKQKKVYGPMPKSDESARTKGIFKPSFYFILFFEK
ncbi:hypothetical protein MTR_5g088210 [Medicago truncatula]|uniref:Uncharacterized protein n=1 Tax=Medicago truncatula TaxID=3880 RepID=G7K7P4_MEDTR|nr:hypothetical protein MTR_5g088210 [Medicago truncatula]